MKRTVLVGLSALMFACGRGEVINDDRASGTAVPESSSAGAEANSQSSQTVALIGCLQGPSLGSATGASGSQGPGRGPENSPTSAAGQPSNDPFVLVDAFAASANSAGVGANGAGGSGGPLVSGKSSYELDGIPAAARVDVHKQVRVVGRLAASTAGSLTPASPAAGVGSPVQEGRPPVQGPSTAAGRAPDRRQLIVETVEVVAAQCTQQ